MKQTGLIATAVFLFALSLPTAPLYGQATREATATSPPIRQLTLFDRRGHKTGTIGKPGAYNQPVFSPDGKRIAVVLNGDIWVFDVAKGTGKQITSTSAPESSPVWSPDGRRIAYAANRGAVGIYQKASDGTGAEEQLYVSGSAGLTDWSKDGKFILSFAGGSQSPTKADLFLLPLGGDRRTITLLDTPANEGGGRFSRNGKYIAYWSDESGANEIYVRRFNAPAGEPPSLGADKWKISSKGGLLVRWRNDGKEIYYLATNGDMLAVNVTTVPSFKAEQPSLLFHVVTTFPLTGFPGGFMDISGDGQRFALLLAAEQEGQPHGETTARNK
jgi:Tol biopolymer transport system component